ncbi:N-dimethylarginine dimethylaminohydrolase [Mycobacterium sp. CBMA293]|uniref:dimethylargininase n=1 Tax=unclassified Mycolicibacterium TaxID=2636767 RepID=UPI0012DEE360|nr:MULTISPECIES: dimethylargininase [unclassified Mycolicibacterium]MUL49525.1 N-dimethylarginine dimethylaminohydrolase [Mycolicibacterium sp. CBMA 360]MUL62109.1 N-dimethylarginine dimethylaminohydrolase [Mycolicibacterium sp. CBMA 335]MUL73384.1 N-dimethylarginine dimethylaminohydrolase [Mycolicibacterium sp. CBMA 311]MUL96553.1 N-dimethylarginine dimethylaminohydrolase [Mycolicibacterium sp. CBMA 230]MUM05452.1 N-dimethylarginine dimethylaminohydrolase [Mycolicibacterium sp. CBMA 213]
MTITDVVKSATPNAGWRPERIARPRHYVMTRPTHFAVEYAINPWMDTSATVDTALAVRQWERLVQTYRSLGHTVDLVDPLPGLPDMVFAANGGLVLDDGLEKVAIIARFTYPQRAGESVAYAGWLLDHDYCPLYTEHTNEGQGDLLIVGSKILAGYGFRTDRQSHDEVAKLSGLPLISLQLVNPRFYHLDTALAVLDDHTIAFYPPAFGATSVALLRKMFPGAIEVADADAHVLGLNAVSDGLNVVHPAAATGFAAQLAAAGFRSLGVDLSELLKGGGSVKCCTLEVYPTSC